MVDLLLCEINLGISARQNLPFFFAVKRSKISHFPVILKNIHVYIQYILSEYPPPPPGLFPSSPHAASHSSAVPYMCTVGGLSMTLLHVPFFSLLLRVMTTITAALPVWSMNRTQSN